MHQISLYRICPVPLRGAFRDRHGRRRRDAVDAHGANDERRRGGRRSRVVLTPRRWCQVGGRRFRQMTVANKPGHRGEHEGNRKTIARGMPGFFRCDRGDCYWHGLFFLPCQAAGALGARHSLRPLIGGQGISRQTSDASRRENEDRYLKIRRVGKGALAPCPPRQCTSRWWARLRFAHPTQSGDRSPTPALPRSWRGARWSAPPFPCPAGLPIPAANERRARRRKCWGRAVP